VFRVGCLSVHIPSSKGDVCNKWVEWLRTYPKAGAVGLQPDLMHACILFSSRANCSSKAPGKYQNIN
jgi:hypothetical protein